MGFFEKLSEGLKKTRENVAYAFSQEKLTDEFYDELEERLILADAGADTAMSLTDELRAAVKEKHILSADEAVAERGDTHERPDDDRTAAAHRQARRGREGLGLASEEPQHRSAGGVLVHQDRHRRLGV